MKNGSLWAVCFFVVLLTACTKTGVGIEKASSKQEYLEVIEKMSADERKKQLAKDVQFITRLLESVDKLQIYNSNLLTSKGERSDSLLNANRFVLPNKDLIRKEFEDISDIHVVQKYAVPSSDFDIRYPHGLRFIHPSDLQHNISKVFVDDKALDATAVGLASADSILLSLDYRFATSADSIVISAKELTDSVSFKNCTIKILKISDKTISILYPSEIQVLDCSAKNVTGTLMHAKRHSGYSVFRVSKTTKEDIGLLIASLQAASAIQDQELCMKILGEIPERLFAVCAQVIDLEEAYALQTASRNTLGTGARELPAQNLEQYKDLLSPVFEVLSLTFDQPYEQVLFYAASEYDTLTTELYVPVDTLQRRMYKVYHDKANLKYGIAHAVGQIIVPATYASLVQTDDFYFVGSADTHDEALTYYLDTAEKILRPLPAGITFVRNLRPGIAIFENEKGRKGVLSQNKVDIVPYRYDEIHLHNNVLIAAGKKGSYIFFELYNTSGKKIKLPPIKKVEYDPDNPNLIVSTEGDMYGLIDKQGTLTIRPQYKDLRALGGDVFKYIAHPEDDEFAAKEGIWGIVRADGKVLTKPKYYSVGRFSEGLAPVYVKKGDNIRGGYIDESGREAIDLQFLFVNPFCKGYALVRMPEYYCLIDKQGKAVKSFPKGTYVEQQAVYRNGSDEVCYETDEMTYDYAGKEMR